MMNLTKRLYRSGRPNWVATVLNRLWAAVHALGVAPNYLVTLEVRGRRSGRRISLPLVMVVIEGERYLVSMLGAEADWVQNVKAADGNVTLHHGRREKVYLEEVAAGRRAPVLRAYLKRAPGARPHLPVDKNAPLSEFERVSAQFPVFRVVSGSLSLNPIKGRGMARARIRPMKAPQRIHIEGHVSAGFEAVRDAFAENFSRRHELGGACCVYHRGAKVVDLWGGVQNKSTRAPWREDTMVVVYSTTKGLAAMTLAVAHSRGWLDYEQRVCAYWPEFAQQGKETITVRQLLAHQAGLFALDEPVNRRLVADLDRLAVVLARQKPAWEPGARQAYHAITLGFYEGELLRRVDPKHRSLGQFFQDEIASPLGLDFYIRLPESIPNSRLATIARPKPITMLLGFPIRFTLAAFNRRSNIYRALIGSDLPHDEQRIYARNLESPSGGGVGTARAIAHAYSVFATGGRELQLRPETLQALSEPAIPATHGFYDECMMGEAQFSLGFMKPSPLWPFGNEGSFGAPGSGGSLGFADPKTGIGYAYVTSQMGTTLTGDPRDLALRNAVYSIIQPAA